MNERPSDFDLLQAFARRGSQLAFADLVRRHLDLVYGTALRKVRDPGGAEEVAQNVFAALVHKAWRFAPDDSLPAWLYQAALLESRQWLRGEMRHRRREQTAAELGTTMKLPDEQPALRVLVPLLDEALLSLREKDRTALLLRFYENRSLRDVGASLGVGEDTAQKRVATALEKLSAYFQRRGFRTATVAAASAALQHTAASAPAPLANSVLLATGQITPPAVLGLVARVASLTKVQTAALCVALAVVPVIWQRSQQQQAREQLVRLQIQWSDAQSEWSRTQSEIDRLTRTLTRLTATAGDAAALAARRADAAAKFAAWKNRLRALLTADDYHWPDDSPFVRIPKSALHDIDVRQPVTPPGVLRQAARELLGLSPEEREQVDAALHRHFVALDGLINASVYETNRPTRFQIPDSAVASQVWFVPPLGNEANDRATEVQQDLENILGPERWPLVKAELDVYGSSSLRQALNLDSGNDPLSAGVWVQNENGDLLVNYGIASGSSTVTSGGTPLAAFAAPSDAAMPAGDMSSTMNGLPDSLTRRIQAWLGQQAATLAGKETAK